MDKMLQVKNVGPNQGRIFNQFWGVLEVAMQDFASMSLLVFIFSNSSSLMALGPESCPAEVHFAAVFAP